MTEKKSERTQLRLGENVKLGKTPARPDAVSFKLTQFLTALPKVPKRFGHEVAVKDWGMLGNDQYGDCVWAGAAHESMLLNAEVAKDVEFTDKSVLGDYSKVTGFNPKEPNSDQGTDMKTAASYRRKTGVADGAGKRHKIAAYLGIKAGDVGYAKAAAYLFGAAGVGIQFPDSAMDQFNNGEPWTPVKGASIEGGHYVPLVGFDGKYLLVVTWGQVQKMSVDFYKEYCDEALAYVSEEFISKGKSPEGFELTQLENDLKVLR
jgi:hypothetical protein